eukprot:NODE_1_length_5926_cov_7.541990.p2 GENE.NODE_1_length_5926_cov_7.541990~~NODE_1_length_5926_cov_7.541990.p2  ORF type:complete len:300 (-),score=48.37 NODE_1_length_5926_cov_7.541990:469-1368(-)
MAHDTKTADLVLVLGTTLGGLSADQIAHHAAERSLRAAGSGRGRLVAGTRVRARPPGLTRHYPGTVLGTRGEALLVQFPDLIDSDLDDDGIVPLPADHEVEVLEGEGDAALGTVCFNLQQTPQDGKMTLRLFGCTDDLLKLVFRELFAVARFKPLLPRWPKTDRALVPYGPNGHRLPEDAAQWMWLDLNDGHKVRLTPGHNIQGAQQPQYMHIGAQRPITHKGETRQPGEGRGTVLRRQNDTTSYLLMIEGVVMTLGIWWLECAARGGVEVLPVVNQEPVFAPRPVQENLADTGHLPAD